MEGNYNCLKIAFDSNESGSLRTEVYPDYKISRKKTLLTEEEDMKKVSFNKQKKRLQDYLTHFCYWYEDSCVEADDVIAYYVQNKEDSEKITIMTGDMDIMQMIGKDVEILYLQKSFSTKTRAVERYEKEPYFKRKHVIFNKSKFKKFFGFPPENIVVIKTVCGDNSDDIKNIKGIKETTFFKLFPKAQESIFTVDDMIQKTNEIISTDGAKYKAQATRIAEGETDGIQGKDIININKRLVDLNLDEFITSECISNLQKNGFLSGFKYKSVDSLLLLNKMKQDGIYDHINYNNLTIKSFFKPFLKTMEV